MQQWKRVLALILALFTLSSALSLPVQAAETPRRALTGDVDTSCGMNAVWSLSGDGTLTVTGTGRMDDYDDVSQLPWRDRRSSVKKVVIGSGITSVGTWAFYGCTKLTAVELPASLREIGSWSFGGCTALKKVHVPDAVTLIGAYAFGYSQGEAPQPYPGLTLGGKSGGAAERYANNRANVSFKAEELLPGANPAVTGLTMGTDGVHVNWGVVRYAAKYKVYYKSSGTWVAAGTTASCSFYVRGLKSGTRYTFAVTALSASGKEPVAPQAAKGKVMTFLTAPTISQLEAQNTGVKVTWGKVTGAVKYRVFCKLNGKWTPKGDTTANSLIVKGLPTGASYTFTVRCVNAKGTAYASSFRPGKTIQYLPIPTLTRVENMATGVKVTWKQVNGAAKYRLFYRQGKSGWKKVTDLSATSYVVKGLSDNSAYSFTVRCLSADGKLYTSGFNTSGLAATFLSPPVLKSVACVNSGVKLTWSKPAGVSKCRVFYKTAASGWKIFTDTTASSAVITGLDSGTKYTFTVRGINNTGSAYTTGYDARGKSILYVAAPELESVEYDDDGIWVRWAESEGAVKYRVFYKSGSTWVKLGDTEDTSFYTDALDPETLHTFTVRCVSANGNSYTSGYDPEGIQADTLPGQPAAYDFTSAYKSSKFYSQLMALHLKSNARDNLVNVAMSQLGYTEGNRYGQWGGTSGGGNNYTEYGMWFYKHVSKAWDYYAGAWCCMFVSWCANEAGIPSSVIPRRALVEDMDDAFGGRYYTWNQTACGYGSKRIQRGDLIIFSASAGGRLSHIAIVTNVTYSGDRCTISTVEGNVKDACRTRRFIMTRGSGGRVDSEHYIRGFCCPSY